MPSEPFVGVLLSRNDCLAGFLSADETQAAVTDDIVTDESTLPQNFGPEPEQVARFIAHWAPSGGAERANFPSFAHNLCDLLGVLNHRSWMFSETLTASNARLHSRILIAGSGCLCVPSLSGVPIHLSGRGFSGLPVQRWTKLNYAI